MNISRRFLYDHQYARHTHLRPYRLLTTYIPLNSLSDVYNCDSFVHYGEIDFKFNLCITIIGCIKISYT